MIVNRITLSFWFIRYRTCLIEVVVIIGTCQRDVTETRWIYIPLVFKTDMNFIPCNRKIDTARILRCTSVAMNLFRKDGGFYLFMSMCAISKTDLKARYSSSRSHQFY